MPMFIFASVAMPWRSLRLGPLHFTVFGMAAALGLIVSMAFARRCALRAGVDPEATWDAGFFAIFSCFVTSRLLLALGSPRAFLHYPLLLLGIPSLTLGGLALAALMTWIYLRRKHLAVLRTLDTFAAPAALLAAFLEAGHWADGTEAGLPTRLPWGTPVPGGPDSLRVHPVALYGAIFSLGLALWLWSDLGSTYAVSTSRAALRPGSITAKALLGGGLAAFGLDMLSAPPVVAGTALLEPGQWVALAAMLAGALVWATAPAQIAGNPKADAQIAPSPQMLLPTPPPLHMEVH